MILAVVATTLAATAVAVGPAPADDGQNVPPAADPQAWAQYVAGFRAQQQFQDWSTARGPIIADSGFRPYDNGFSFFNWSVPDVKNSSVYGVPKRGAPNLVASTIRELMGPKVCIGNNASGSCRLTVAGKKWRDQINEDMDTQGHCFGMAGVASMMFDGSVSPADYQAAATSPYDVEFRAPIQKEIAKIFSAQYLRIKQYDVSAVQLVEQLRAGLRPGSAGYILGIFGAGGHAVTPYALHDAGNGEYDIAIYDNNYPDMQRVIRVNTVAGTVSYNFVSDPEHPDNPVNDDSIWSQQLIPVDAVSGRQPCPFCPRSKTTQVSFDYQIQSTATHLSTRVTKLNGEKFPRLKVIRPGTKDLPPTFVLPTGKPFQVHVKSNRKKRASFDLSTITGAYQLGMKGITIPAGQKAVLTVNARRGSVLYRGAAAASGKSGELDFLDNADNKIVEVKAKASSATTKAVGGRVDRRKDVVTVFPSDRKPAEAKATASLEFYRGGKAGTLTTTIKTSLPGNGVVLVDYSRWSPKHRSAIRAYRVVAGRRFRIDVPRPTLGR